MIVLREKWLKIEIKYKLFQGNLLRVELKFAAQMKMSSSVELNSLISSFRHISIVNVSLMLSLIIIKCNENEPTKAREQIINWNATKYF